MRATLSYVHAVHLRLPEALPIIREPVRELLHLDARGLDDLLLLDLGWVWILNVLRYRATVRRSQG
jgi:hypothetical protein